MLVHLFEPYQKTSFIILCKRIASSVMGGFLNKVILLLPQRTNIARGQMVMVWGEPLVLKMPWFLSEAGFENTLNFNKIVCLNV